MHNAHIVLKIDWSPKNQILLKIYKVKPEDIFGTLYILVQFLLSLSLCSKSSLVTRLKIFKAVSKTSRNIIEIIVFKIQPSAQQHHSSIVQNLIDPVREVQTSPKEAFGWILNYMQEGKVSCVQNAKCIPSMKVSIKILL